MNGLIMRPAGSNWFGAISEPAERPERVQVRVHRTSFVAVLDPEPGEL